ncbi:hypothetical protein NDU88_004940 [Pleurodeles waltl]|uniref:Uncharacterized protein n=1 Tax=Pleurodeles waltl TaxID=8319 RepID=A0AAV7UHI0_PLEWA|nr:hypothetical protein NDU88_004940 [Pleurodeles waltl]
MWGCPGRRGWGLCSCRSLDLGRPILLATRGGAVAWAWPSPTQQASRHNWRRREAAGGRSRDPWLSVAAHWREEEWAWRLGR